MKAPLITIALLAGFTGVANAGNVTPQADFQAGDPLTADSLNTRISPLAPAVNDNDSRLNNLSDLTRQCSSGQAMSGVEADGSPACFTPSTGGGTGGISEIITPPASGIIGGGTSSSITLGLDTGVIQSNALTAIGVEGDTNSRNHAKYTDTDAQTAMGTRLNTNPLNHDRYTDTEAQNAMGTRLNTNPLNHDRYTDTEAQNAMGTLSNSNALRHNRYTNSEAVNAVQAGTNVIDTAQVVDGAITGKKLATGYISVGPTAYRSLYSNGCNTFSNTVYIYVEASSTRTNCILYANLNLPHGAALTNITCYIEDIYDDAATTTSIDPVTVRFARGWSDRNATTSIATLSNTALTAGGQATVPLTSAIKNYTVDNSLTHYSLQVTFQDTTVVGSSQKMFGCVITYN